MPDPAEFADPTERKAVAASLQYMALKPGTLITSIPIDRAFIGSCTNGRIEDLRAAAAVARGHRVAPGVNVIVVPGSGLVKRQAEAEGLDKIFRDAGMEWREAGCSMCLAMNPDVLEAGSARGHEQPQLRGPARQGWPHASRVARDGRRRGGGRPLC